MSHRTRRTLLSGAGSAVVVALAGCTDAASPGSGDDGASERVDRTGADTVTVTVGAGDGFAFAPKHVAVDPGTTVVWEWTGKGGGHNVVAVDGAFESALTDEAGFTFEHAFSETGLFEYVCTPHQTRGMVGSVEVVE
ncbi:halocyanin domain-containing protein [Halorubrum sp. CBA1125]|uniref:halocyanin domain-containing protein n=1 Tax=Halorubrum sp. CBA1125 TaxID=2668072 RepID=UPI0012E903A7|nr:halocyanin domain-containing protein [Halorubrum sp. CBA1125]MUW14131.1 halocyanin domain-containing protein [Halorubrum sp. CBA1125]